MHKEYVLRDNFITFKLNKSNKLHVSFIDIFRRFCQYALKASLKAFDIDMFLDRHVYKYVCHICVRTSFVSMTINQCIQRHWQIHAFCYFWYAYHPVFDHHCSIENKENRLKIWVPRFAAIPLWNCIFFEFL